MAISIDYASKVINVPKADLLLVQSTPVEIRQLNMDEFRLELNDLMDDPAGMSFGATHAHTAPLTVAGVTLARVVEILEPYTVEFEDGLYNVNIVGGNSNISDRTVKNSVGVNTANSAGLQDPFALQAAAFTDGAVHMDQANGLSGTTFPRGTRGFPVDNVADALSIAVERGIGTVRLLGSATLGSGDFSDGYTFLGDNRNFVLTLEEAPDVTYCEFQNLTIQGDLDGFNTLRDCTILDINYFNGFIFRCGISGTVTLAGTSTASILQSFSLVAGGGPGEYATIDLGGIQETPLVVRDWQGGLQLKNLTSAPSASVSLDMSSGRVVLASSVTAGDITIRGIASIEDNSGGTATVTDQTISTCVQDLHEFRGLAAGSPLTMTDSAQTVAGKSVSVSDDGTTTTVERQ